MSYRVIRAFYLMGPRGKSGARRFFMVPGTIFETQRKYGPYFDAFIFRGNLDIVNARPTLMFKEGDFRPVKHYQEPRGFREKVDRIVENAQRRPGLPKPLGEMSKTWLMNQKKADLVGIAKVLGVENSEGLTIPQLVRVVMNEKENESLPPLPKDETNIVPEKDLPKWD